MIEKQLDPITEHFHIARDDVIQKNCKGLARRVATELLYGYASTNQREIGDMLRVDSSSGSVVRKRLHEALT